METFSIAKIEDVINGITLKSTNSKEICALEVDIEPYEYLVAGGFVNASIDTLFLY